MKNSTKVLLYAIPSVLLLSCGGGLLGFAHKSRTDRDFAIARLAKLGLPTNPSQIKHTPNPEKDAGALLTKFEDVLDSVRETPAGIAYFDYQKRNVQARRALIKANPHLVRMRRQIFTKSEWITKFEPSLNGEDEYSEFGKLRGVLDFAGAEAQVLAVDGKPTQALELLSQNAKFIHVFHANIKGYSGDLSNYFQIPINRRAAITFSGNAIRADVRLAMRNFLQASDHKVDFRRSIADEISDSLALEEDVRHGNRELGQLAVYPYIDPDSFWDKATLSLFRIKGVPETLFGRLYNAYSDLFEAVPSDPNQFRQRIRAADNWEAALAKNTGPNMLLVRATLANYALRFRREAQLKAEWRTLNALLIATEIKSKTGKYPSTLPVTGQDAIDPFTDKPLKYLLKGGKLTIYSVGQDLSDDNGLLFRPTTSSSSGSSSPAQDTGFSIPYVVPQRLQ